MTQRTNSHNLFIQLHQGTPRLRFWIYLKLKGWIWERITSSHFPDIQHAYQHNPSVISAMQKDINERFSSETHVRPGRIPCECKELNSNPKMKSGNRIQDFGGSEPTINRMKERKICLVPGETQFRKFEGKILFCDDKSTRAPRVAEIVRE